MQHITHFIDGKAWTGQAAEQFDSINPATGQTFARVDQADEDVLNAAIDTATKGQAIWAAMPAIERGRILQKAADLLRVHNDEIAALEVTDTGKPWQEASVVDVVTGADVIEYYAGLTDKVEGVYQQLSPSQFYFTRQEPLGICAGIGAWNYPVQIACWKSGPALAAGNAMIFKPSEETPATAIKLAEVFAEAGLPDGVFSVIQGDARVGQMLTNHPDIAKVSFTGESGTGKKVMAASATSLKQVTMELGGKSPLIIFPDMPIEQAVTGAMVANFYTQGEVCTHGTRVFVHEDIATAFLESLVKRSNALKVGDPTDPETQIGALISRGHMEKVLGYIDAAKEAGASLLCGGYQVTENGLENGNFVAPTVFSDCNDDMPQVREEIFGPVMSVLTFKDEDEVIARANDTEYGLAAGVFTRDIARANRVINQLQAGICWINTWGNSPAEMPVGGYKLSGVGRENGMQTLLHYTQTKAVFTELADLPDEY